jgi:hypothetical protein
MNIEAEIIVIRLALAWLLRSEKRQAPIAQEVDDIIADFAKQGGTFSTGGQGDQVRQSLTQLLSDGAYVGLIRPFAGEDPEVRKFRVHGLG